MLNLLLKPHVREKPGSLSKVDIISHFLQKFSISFSDFFAKQLSIISTTVLYCGILSLGSNWGQLGPNWPKIKKIDLYSKSIHYLFVTSSVNVEEVIRIGVYCHIMWNAERTCHES